MRVPRDIPGCLRRLAVAALLLAQVNLLFASALHHHQAEANPAPGEMHFCPAGDHLSPAVTPETLCVACQIVRHSVARVGTGNFTPPRRSVQPFRSLLVGARAPSVPHLASRGRAPPLS